MSKRKTDRKIKRITGRSMNFNRLDPELNRLPKEGHGFIYRYTFRNGRCYIGQTIRTIKERTINHTDKTMLVDKVMRSGAKFTADILAEVPYDFLDDAEMYCIHRFNTIVPNGYNMDFYDHKGLRLVPDDVKKKVSEGVRRALEDPVKGKRMRESIKQAQEVCKKEIICLETGKIYGSITDAADDIGCHMSNVSSAIRYTSNTAKGYHFMYFTGYIKHNRREVLNVLKTWELEKKKIGIKRRKEGQKRTANEGSWKGTRLWCRENGLVFESIQDASRRLNIDEWKIQKIINDKRKNDLPFTLLKLV